MIHRSIECGLPRVLLETGRYRVRLAATVGDVAAMQAMRCRLFGIDGDDRDAFDDRCSHVMIEDRGAVTRLLGGFRLLELADGRALGQSYSAQSYDLSMLRDYPGRILEIGRFCIDADAADADLLRLAWGAIAIWVDTRAIGMLVGCASFDGIDVQPYLDAFAVLERDHLGPHNMRARIRAAEVIRMGDLRAVQDEARALRQIPPLLRSYLAMGAWVSDHAVVDRRMNTLHVFTALEIAAIPPARKRWLRAVSEPSM